MFGRRVATHIGQPGWKGTCVKQCFAVLAGVMVGWGGQRQWINRSRAILIEKVLAMSDDRIIEKSIFEINITLFRLTNLAKVIIPTEHVDELSCMWAYGLGATPHAGRPKPPRDLQHPLVTSLGKNIFTK